MRPPPRAICSGRRHSRLSRARVARRELLRASGDRARGAAFFARFPGGRFENLRVTIAGDLGTFEWDCVTADGTRTAGCDLLRFEGDLVKVKNAFRKQRG